MPVRTLHKLVTHEQAIDSVLNSNYLITSANIESDGLTGVDYAIPDSGF